MMLSHLGEADAATAVRDGVRRVLAGGSVRTRDLGGTASTMQMADAIADAARSARDQF
jgi:tartrate dehydrogenase/decarboxylase/D-malate dehydrogenase